MKRSDELKIQRKEKIDAMQSILDAAKDKDKGTARALTTDEQTKFDDLKREAAALQSQIDNALELEREHETQPPVGAKTPPVPFTIKRNADAVYSVGKAVREFARNNSADGLTGIEAESHQELNRGISSTGLLIPTSARQITPNDSSTNAAQIDVKIDPALSVLGKEPMWQKMGLTVLPGLVGSIKIGKLAPVVAGKYSENAEIAQESNIPSFVTLSPERFGVTDIFTKELLAQSNPAVQAAIINDMVMGCDRKITAEAYAVALAAAAEVAQGAISKAGFDALMAAVDADGGFAMDRATFFAAKDVKIDAGSGKFLVTMGTENGIGATHEGVPAYFSQLFDDGTAQQYIVYGAWKEVYAGLWDALEVLVNPYTYQKGGQIEVTVNRLADLAVRNPSAFVKSPDLDATT